ncbi:unnamed protein product [Effrenium voratum]|nr:unnamed protein product [Effrenium voratum]
MTSKAAALLREAATVGYNGQGPGLPPLPSKRAPPPPGGGPAHGAPYRAGLTRRSSSTSALRKSKGRLSPLVRSARTDEMASTEPSRAMCQASSKVLELARRAEEVLKVGEWSVRKLPDNPEITFVYLNEAEGRVEVEAPREVMDELLEGGQEDSPKQEDPEERPLFRRILLAKAEVPLRMARDILEAIREDVNIFEQVQQRFSDTPDEPLLGLEDDLGEELEAVAQAMQPGEVSDVLGTEAGMQILLRVR